MSLRLFKTGITASQSLQFVWWNSRILGLWA